VGGIALGTRTLPRATIMQEKTHRPVQFEITEPTRGSIAAWIDKTHLSVRDYLFPSRVIDSGHITTRQYARIVASWVESIGLDPAAYSTRTMRRTKVTLIYRQTKNLRAVQLLLGYTNLESIARYFGIKFNDVL
jgi:site-specific recombinase XerD